jgi:hypothetical protein
MECIENVDLSEFIDVSQSIPKLIHQIWLGKQDDNALPPKKYQCAKYLDSVVEMNPEYTRRIWSMADIKELFRTRPELRRWKHFFFNGLHVHIEKCDFIRYILMWLYGGVYLDMDFRCHKGFDCILKGRSFAWVVDWIHCNTLTLGAFNGQFAIFNGFLASAPNQPIWPKLCDFIMSRYDTQPSGLVMNTTGPLALGAFCNVYNLADEHKLPQMYINRCYIIGEGFMVSKHELAKNPCTNIAPIVSTEWIDGSGWEYDAAPMYVSFYVQRKHVVILFLMLCIVIFLAILLRKRGQALQTCEIAVKNCPNQPSSS